MEKPPRENGRSDEQEAEHLVTTVDTALLNAARLLGGLLLERLDAELNHDA
jgi:hypothetical protein